MSPKDVAPQVKRLWAAEIARRAREVAEGKVTLVDADEVHAEAAEHLRRRSAARIDSSKGPAPLLRH